MAENFKTDGGIPSPPIALDGSRASSAAKVLLKEISMEDSEYSEDVKVLKEGELEVTLNTEWKKWLNSSALSAPEVAQRDARCSTPGKLDRLEKLRIYR